MKWVGHRINERLFSREIYFNNKISSLHLRLPQRPLYDISVGPLKSNFFFYKETESLDYNIFGPVISPKGSRTPSNRALRVTKLILGRVSG